MRKTDLLAALGKANEKYVDEAVRRAEQADKEIIVKGAEIMDKRNVRRKIAPAAAIAASFAFAIGAAAYIGARNDSFSTGSGDSSDAGSSTVVLNTGMEQNHTPISDIDTAYSAETLLLKEYDNLVFDENFIVEFPEIDSFETFTMSSKPELSGQEVYDLFDSAVDKYFPGAFTEDEKKELYSATGTNADGETLSGNFEQYKDDFLGEDAAPFMFMTSEHGMIQMFGNGSTQTVTGAAAFSLDALEQESVGMYCAADNNTITERIYIPQNGIESDIEYDLLNGSVKLTDAIDYTEDILTNDFDEEVANPELVPDVYDAWIVDMGDGIYGYHFVMTCTYNDIRFDAQPMIKAGSSNSVMGDCKPYANFPAYAFTIENEKLDSVMGLGYELAYDISDVQVHNSMITVEEAVNILSQSVSSGAGLVIERAEFMYTPYYENEDDAASSLIVDAAWRFMGSNANDGYSYLFYVNAVTGEFDYYKYS